MDRFVSRKKLKTTKQDDEKQENESKGEVVVNLGNESQIKYIPNLFCFDESSAYLKFLNEHIPWTRPTIRVFGRSLLQVSLSRSLALSLSFSLSLSVFLG